MSSSSRLLPSGIAAAVLLLLATLSPTGRAASTDISAEPVITRSNVAAKPNLMFILDDSGSMDWSYMPDELGDSNNDPRYGKYGYWSAQCNGLAFDPNADYPLPKTSANVDYPNMSYTAARNDGYLTSSSTRDLTGSYYYQYAATTTTPKPLSWTYSSSGAVDTSTTFYRECMSDIGSSPGSGKFTKVNMDTASGALKEKYANWFSYYARRFLLMRTAVGRAVQALDSSYRVGFSRINSASISDGADFRDAKVFDTTQKANFYSSLYGAAPNGGTPLRGALSKVGRYYAKKLSGQTYDPVEYACQRNYAILTTDGYWNSGGGPIAESSTYGPLDLNGDEVGNRDTVEVRPMYDGGDSITSTATPTTTVTLKKIDTRTKTTTISKRDMVVVARSNCSGSRTRTSRTAQQRTESYFTDSTAYSQETLTSTRTVTVTNGTQTGDSTSNSTTTTTPSSPVAPAPVNSGAADSGWVDGATTTGNCANGGTIGTTYQNANPPSTTSTQNQGTPTPTTVSVTGPTVGAANVTNTTTGGTSNTLADVAQYYYATDLRNAALGNCASKNAANVVTDVCSDIVPIGGRDLKSSQHMTTYSIGLGVSGTLVYDKDYLTGSSADFNAVSNVSGSGTTKNWPATTTSISGSSGDARNIDDLWHAAVNGRGQYYSALNANELSAAIAGVVSTIAGITGAGAAASFDTLALVAGDVNRVYQASYTTGIWAGDLKVFTVNGETGAIGESPVWSAQEKLKSKLWSDRKIYYKGTSTLRAFNHTNLNADGYVTNFSGLCNKTPIPTQCSGLDTAKKALADDATNLINYLRGDATYESGTNKLYRSRTTSEGRRPLGDIINGAPVYVGKPPFGYTDAGYATFASDKAARAPMVYVGANDGMLHAFSAISGEEIWAYVPTAVIGNMYKLANASYEDYHQYFVDGEPVIGDIFVGGAWKTILVGGLGAGGKSYYALDITDPALPTTLWEFTDANMGLSYGNPIITKRADGTWVVALSSGYNNTTGDGKGHLYILNAYTGAKLLDMSTTAGSASSPSGLAKINAWIDKSTNNTTKRFYGGDLFGNLWRFDMDNLVEPNQQAHLMAQLQTSAGVGQPITTRPEPVLISGTFPAVAVATGRYLGTSDVTDNTQQGIYLLKDSLTATGLGVVRSNNSVVKHTVSVSGVTATTTTEGVTWDTQNGWWFDLPQTGERVVTNMGLVGNTLTVASAVPSGDACTTGGSSWLYRIDITNGLAKKNIPFGELFDSKVVIVGLTAATLTSGDSRLFVKDSSGKTTVKPGEPAPEPGSGDVRRSSWRELID